MTDKDILDFFIDSKRNKLIEARVSKKYLEKNAIEYKNYLDNRYNDSFEKYSEVISRIYHKIDVKPCCKNCGKPLKFKGFTKPYGKWCNTKCQLTDKTFIKWRNSIIDYAASDKKAKQTCLERYGDKNYRNIKKAKETLIKLYGTEKNAMLHKLEKIKNTCLERYGVENVYQSEVIKDKCKNTKLQRYGDPHYKNREKIKNTCLERYGVENYLQTNNEKLKRGSKENLNKVKQTCLERYGVEYYFQSEDYKEKNKQTCLERYGVEHYSTTLEHKYKVYNTKKKNKSFNSSKIESRLKQYFLEKNISVIYQYKSELYPYMCDFYFPKSNSYVEIQGNWTHGGHPFDKNNEEDLNILNLWKSKNNKYYNIAIKVWTISDVEKRNLAKLNNINFFEIFSIDFNYIISELIHNNII